MDLVIPQSAYTLPTTRPVAAQFGQRAGRSLLSLSAADIVAGGQFSCPRTCRSTSGTHSPAGSARAVGTLSWLPVIAATIGFAIGTLYLVLFVSAWFLLLFLLPVIAYRGLFAFIFDIAFRALSTL